MKKSLFIVLYITLASVLAHAQTVYTGVNTKTPGSTLDVNGSLAAAYLSVTASTYNAGEGDCSIKWTGTADGTITLPASTAGPDRSGRLYFLKNASLNFVLTVKGNGSELIDNSNTLVLDPGEALLMVKTDNNAATGSTYMVLQVSKTQTTYAYSMSGTSVTTVTQGQQGKLDLQTVDSSTNGGADFNTTTNNWTCPQSGWYSLSASTQSSAAAGAHASLILRKNTTGALAQLYFFIPGGGSLINSGYVSKVAKLAQGDQISIIVLPCLGCGTATYRFQGCQLDVTRL